MQKDNSIIPAEKIYANDTYLLNSYMLPFWSSGIIYNETIMFIGKEQEVRLLYKPDKIIAVRSYDLKTKYDFNIDYVLIGNKLKLTELTSIPYFDINEYYPASCIKNKSFPCTKGGYIVYGEGDFITQKQIVVTYRRSELWDGYIPENQSHKLKNTISKLKNKENLKIVFYGDSITVGGNSSGFIGVEPFMPVWPKMVTEKLKVLYDYDDINYINTSVGGTSSAWAVNNAETNVADYNPDLAVIAFGMNDINFDPKIHKNNIMGIIDIVSEKCPQTEFILVSTMLPNEEVQGFFGNQYLFENEYKDIIKDYNNIALACMTEMHNSLLNYKRFYDMTGNNVNHCNDFLARVYAHTVLTTMVGRYDKGI